MFFAVWMGGPFLCAAVLGAAFARGWWRTYALFGLGLLLGLAFIFLGYLSGSKDPGDCSDCEKYWGRWWEPQFVSALAGVGYFFWLIGIGAGAFFRVIITSARKRPPAAR
jgi:hypothetical protein